MNNSALAELRAMGTFRKVPSVAEGISCSLSISDLQHIQRYCGISQCSKLKNIVEFFVNQYSDCSYDISGCL